jgi:hypothetical protein
VFSPGQPVVLKPSLPQSADHVGTVISIDADGAIWVQWVGPEAPTRPTKYSAKALVLWESA